MFVGPAGLLANCMLAIHVPFTRNDFSWFACEIFVHCSVAVIVQAIFDFHSWHHAVAARPHAINTGLHSNCAFSEVNATLTSGSVNTLAAFVDVTVAIVVQKVADFFFGLSAVAVRPAAIVTGLFAERTLAHIDPASSGCPIFAWRRDSRL